MFGNMYGFNPYAPQMGPQTPFFPGPIQTPTQPATPPSAPPVAAPAFIQVPSAKDFDSVAIQPGKPALIMSQNDPYIAFKSADAMGLVTTSLYRLEPVTAEQVNGPAVEYATKGELAQVQQMVQQLIDGINKTAAKTTKKEGSE